MISPRHHDRLADGMMAGESRFDFARFDAKTTNFDLLILAAKKFNVAIGQPAGQIARPIQALQWRRDIRRTLPPSIQDG